MLAYDTTENKVATNDQVAKSEWVSIMNAMYCFFIQKYLSEICIHCKCVPNIPIPNHQVKRYIT